MSLTAFSNFLLLLATEWVQDMRLKSWLVLQCFNCGPLKMWPKLLGGKYTYSKSYIWFNVPSPFLLQFGAFDRHPLASSGQSACSRWGSSQDFETNFRKTYVLAWFSLSFPTFDVFFFMIIVPVEHPTAPIPNLLVDYSIYLTHSIIPHAWQ